MMPFWFYFTPVIYPLERIPENWRWLVAINPMAPIVELYKWGTLGVGTVTAGGLVTSLSLIGGDVRARDVVLQSRGIRVGRQALMKILFSMRHSGALRNYASTLRELAERGHQIHLAFMMPDKVGDARLLWELTNDHPSITYGELGKKTPWRFWLGMARGVRALADYVRYGTPEYARADALRARAAIRVPALLRAFLALPIVRTRLGLRVVSRFLLALESCDPGRSLGCRHDRQPGTRHRARDAARRCRLRPGGIHQGGEGAGRSLGAVRAQLGQPHEQGAHPGAARSRVRVERHPEARSGDDARRVARVASS